MTPELKVLEATLKSQLNEILEQSIKDSQSQLNATETGDAVSLQPQPSDDVSIIDTSTNYAYSNKIGFYREDPYIRGSDSMYRNREGKVLSHMTPTQMRELNSMSSSQRASYLAQYLAATTNIPSLNATQLRANYAPYREIDTLQPGWWQLGTTFDLGSASRMRIQGESANIFVGVTSPKTVMDIGFYANSYFWNSQTDTNPGWGGFVNIYDTGRYPNGAYFDFGVNVPKGYPTILTYTKQGFVILPGGTFNINELNTRLWVRNDLSNGGTVAAIFQYYIGGPIYQVAPQNPFRPTTWKYFFGLSAKSTEVRLYRSVSLLSIDGAKSVGNNFISHGLWRTKTSSAEKFTSLNVRPNTNVTGNEFPYQTCPSAGGVWTSGPIYMNCQDKSPYYTGRVDIEVR
jgi:hypothetical protein